MTTSEPPRIDRIDMSMFHDLMHAPFTQHCRSLYGGWRRHIALWWEFKAEPAIRTATTCRLGRHDWCDTWRRGKPPTQTCWFCECEKR